jgi:hypothetical protein
MADDRYSYWVHEYGRTSRLPSVAATLALFAIVTVVLIIMLGGHDRLTEGANRGKPASLCQEHAGRPGWSTVCDRERVAEQIRQVRER